jgi:hypothetical protein
MSCGARHPQHHQGIAARRPRRHPSGRRGHALILDAGPLRPHWLITTYVDTHAVKRIPARLERTEACLPLCSWISTAEAMVMDATVAAARLLRAALVTTLVEIRYNA